MACPLCGDRCTCSTADASSGGRTTVLIDPDSFNSSNGYSTDVSVRSIADDQRPTTNDSLVSAAYSDPIAVNQAGTDFYRPADTSWRTEITSRVRAHRRRRGVDPDASLDLGFDAPVRQEIRAVRSRFSTTERDSGYSTDSSVRTTAFETAALAATDLDDQRPKTNNQSDHRPLATDSTPSRYQRIAMKRREAQMESGVLIEFPRPQTYDLFPDALAEPLPVLPRILEAEEEVPPAELNSGSHAYASIQLDSPHAVAEDLQEPVAIELPLQVAPMSPRVVSAMIDAGLVCTATALFALTVLLFAPFGPSAQAALMPEGKLAVAFGLSLPTLFWAAYHYLFLVYAGITPGMQMAQVELSSFEGCFPARPTRAARAAALVLSCLSLGMGFAWSLFDEDSLGWHDRITRTYLRQS